MDASIKIKPFETAHRPWKLFVTHDPRHPSSGLWSSFQLSACASFFSVNRHLTCHRRGRYIKTAAAAAAARMMRTSQGCIGIGRISGVANSGDESMGTVVVIVVDVISIWVLRLDESPAWDMVWDVGIYAFCLYKHLAMIRLHVLQHQQVTVM